MKQILNGTITIQPARQNTNPHSQEEMVTIEYHGLDGKYLSSTRFAYKRELFAALLELIDIIYAESDARKWTKTDKSYSPF